MARRLVEPGRRIASNRLLLLGLLALLCSGCPRTNGTGGTTPLGGEGGDTSLEVPDEVTESSYPGLARSLRAATLETEGRAELRGALVAYLRGRFDQALEEREPGGAWDRLAEALGLFEPSELQAGSLGEDIAHMATEMLDVYEPRGD